MGENNSNLNLKLYYLPETVTFLSAQVTVLSSFFQVFIILWMHNFGSSCTFDDLMEKGQKRALTSLAEVDRL